MLRMGDQGPERKLFNEVVAEICAEYADLGQRKMIAVLEDMIKKLEDDLMTEGQSGQEETPL